MTPTRTPARPPAPMPDRTPATLPEPVDVGVAGVRLALRRWDPPRRRRTTPALLLHGIPDDSSTWAGLAALLCTDRVVLAPDLPGLGRSELRGPYDIATTAQRLAALVLHATEGLPGDGRVDVVGHDWGGVAALAVARERPDLIRRVVVISAPSAPLPVTSAPHLPLLRLALVPELAFRLGGPALGRAMVRAGWRGQEPPPKTLLAAAGGYAAPARAAAMLGWYRATPPASAPIAADRALLVWGVADPVLHLQIAADTLRDLQRGTPAASQVSVPGAGHWPHLAAPDAVLPAIVEFLRAP